MNWMQVQEYLKRDDRCILPLGSTEQHASWMEDFPWTRLAGVVVPETQKPMCDVARLRTLGTKEVRTYLGDGNYGGRYRRSDEEMLAIWAVGVEEARALLTDPWE